MMNDNSILLSIVQDYSVLDVWYHKDGFSVIFGLLEKD